MRALMPYLGLLEATTQVCLTHINIVEFMTSCHLCAQYALPLDSTRRSPPPEFAPFRSPTNGGQLMRGFETILAIALIGLPRFDDADGCEKRSQASKGPCYQSKIVFDIHPVEGRG